MHLTQLRTEAEAHANNDERQEALDLIARIEDQVRATEVGFAEIEAQHAAALAPARISKPKLALYTTVVALLAYAFTRHGLVAILEAGGYQERHSGRFITAASAPFSYWAGLCFFGFSSVTMSLLTIAGILGLFTHPVPFLQWLKGRGSKNSVPKP